ncbi:GH25 family lysozyme [Lactobacillus johnsonii]|uniref:GH25 family lysozyme n=1 Tax=Lactobacillus johnsonii TaxID=33959 RepID=UPI003D0216F5
MQVAKRSYGVDVSSFQGTDLVKYANLGAKYAFVKVSEGLDYRNPKAQAQINSAKANNMLVMGYHYARFSGDSNMAVQEGHYTVNSAKEVDLPKGSYLACDWETGSGNVTDQGYEVSANAILAFLDVVAGAGYKPLLYSGAALLKGNIDTAKVLAKYPNCLWVAAYPLGNGVPASEPNFGYFPSMDGVAIWQFTDNWKNIKVDGNISLIDLKLDATAPNPQPSKPTPDKPTPKTWTDVQGMTWHAEDGTFITGGAINLRWGASTESMLITTLPAGSVVKYNAWARDSAGRVWLQQPRGSNHYGYLVGRVGNDAWGTFK